VDVFLGDSTALAGRGWQFRPFDIPKRSLVSRCSAGLGAHAYLPGSDGLHFEQPLFVEDDLRRRWGGVVRPDA
jgi:hypothetical protein